MVQVRESSRFGFCYALGELIGETPTRYIYRNRAGIAYVSKGSLEVAVGLTCRHPVTAGRPRPRLVI